MDAQTLHINLIVPHGWHELTDEQLRYVFNLIALEMSSDEIAITCLLHWSNTQVIGRQPDGAYLLKQGTNRASRRQRRACSDSAEAKPIDGRSQPMFEVHPLAIAELVDEIRWLAKVPATPVRPSAIGKAKAIAADFQGVPFENFIVCDNLYKGYLQTQNDEMLDDLCSLCGHKLRLSAAERISIFYWMASLKEYFSHSEEWHNYAVQIEQAEANEQLRRQKLLAQRVAEWKKKYEYQEARKRYDLEMELLHEAYQKGLIEYQDYLQAQADMKKKYANEYMPESAKPSADSPKMLEKQKQEDLARVKSLYDQGLIDKTQYEQAKDRIERSYEKKQLDRIRRFGSTETNQLLDIYEAWKNFFDATEEDGGNWATRLAALASSVFAVMSAGMQQASQFIQAQADLDVANAEKRYDREIELAEGNSYLTKKLEKQKAAEIAKIKNEANRKAYSMQVIQAVAQTATNALNAYGSAAQVPVIGYILAPIAAAMAVAAGAIQIATIKKQQQASEAQGYSEGGFTPEGDKDKPVGIVHAGEWVASQKLTRNPKTRPFLEALEYAQRTNTVGSLTHDAVSYLMPATAGTTQGAILQSPQPNVVVNIPQSGSDNKELAETLSLLRARLNEPFVTVNTVSGDHGIQQAQNEYDRLIKNKSPKFRK